MSRPNPLTRRLVITRDGRCVYCNHGGSPKNPLTLDHIITRKAGGVRKLWNVVAACERCNGRRGALPITAWLEVLHARSPETALRAQGKLVEVIGSRPKETATLRSVREWSPEGQREMQQ